VAVATLRKSGFFGSKRFMLMSGERRLGGNEMF
jgi:hypothetical protein